MMNLFRLAADLCHVLSIVVLILHLRVSKIAIGISLKTQDLRLIVFVTRYLDLFTSFYSYYNSLMKILYITATAYIIYMIKGMEPYKSNFDEAGDSFLHYRFAVAPCVVLAVVTRLNEDFNPTEVKLLRALYLWRDVFG
jgi:ER lumen protein retaining receptor